MRLAATFPEEQLACSEFSVCMELRRYLQEEAEEEEQEHTKLLLGSYQPLAALARCASNHHCPDWVSGTASDL
jgi:hypothetical protein